MKIPYVMFAFLLCIPLIALHAADPPAKKPNILLIYTDDHGWADLGAQGVDKDICTPHLDQLANDGIRFTRGYASAPQCMPSRCGLITGRYQQRFGVEDNTKGPLPLNELTLAERLNPAGYLSGFVGKSHLDIANDEKDKKGSKAKFQIRMDHLPPYQGFTEYFRGEMLRYYASHDLHGNLFPDAPRLVRDDRFRVKVQTEAALAFLDRRAAKPEQPWFLYLAWYAPHVPLESPEPWFSKTPTTLPLKRRQALAMIAAMDDGLGQIRAKLKAMEQEQNTLIFFIGDNGAPLGAAWDGSINHPLVGQKGMLAEGGIRTPFLAAWPGQWPAGTTYDQPVIALDVAATAVALAGLPHDSQLDGVNLSPFVTGKHTTAPHERLFWRWGSQAAVLEMPFKLIMLGKQPPLLFDMTTPEGENSTRNLAVQRPEIVARLEQRLRAWAAELQPSGLSTDRSAFSQHHEALFAEHCILAAQNPDPSDPVTRAAVPRDNMQGWIARNGTLALKEGALTLIPETNRTVNARPFLAHSGLDIAGPVTLTLRIRAKQSGTGTFTWRTQTEKDFTADNRSSFTWPASATWEEINTVLPVKGRLRHLRIMPALDCTTLEIASIVFKGSTGAPLTFCFDVN